MRLIWASSVALAVAFAACSEYGSGETAAGADDSAGPEASLPDPDGSASDAGFDGTRALRAAVSGGDAGNHQARHEKSFLGKPSVLECEARVYLEALATNATGASSFTSGSSTARPGMASASTSR
jgi:hypothetical protein